MSDIIQQPARIIRNKGVRRQQMIQNVRMSEMKFDGLGYRKIGKIERVDWANVRRRIKKACKTP